MWEKILYSITSQALGKGRICSGGANDHKSPLVIAYIFLQMYNKIVRQAMKKMIFVVGSILSGF